MNEPLTSARPSADQRVEAAWLEIEAHLGHEGARTLSGLLEQILGVSPFDPDTPALRGALEERLAHDTRYRQVAPGRWMEADRIPAPPASLRLPTVRLEHDAAVLIEAREHLKEHLREEGTAAFTRRLAFREIQAGALRLGPVAAEWFPTCETTLVRVRHEHLDLPAWVGPSGRHMVLFGLEDVLQMYHPGQYLRFTRVESTTIAVEALDRFDEAYHRSESRLFDLESFRALRRFGMPYRDHLRVLLEAHPAGLTAREVIDALESELGFRPNASTIRGLLSASPAFALSGGRWTPAVGIDPASPAPDLATLETWYREEGALIGEKAPYRAVMLTVGGTPAPMIVSLSRSRPEWVVWLVSEDSRSVLPTIREGVPALFAGEEPVGEIEVVTRDHQDLRACLEAAREGLRAIQSRGIASRDLLVDITGGTKVMSAAAVVATHLSGCGYAYVAGHSRNKDGLGTVVSGTEVMRILDGVRT